jgi:hypothetical protein
MNTVYYYFMELKMNCRMIAFAAVMVMLTSVTIHAGDFLDRNFLRLLLLEKGIEPSMSEQILVDPRIAYNNSILIQNLYEPSPGDKPRNNAATNPPPIPAQPVKTGDKKKLPGNVDQKYIDLGRQFIKDWKDTFTLIEAEYHVPAEAITAILIIESKLGRDYERYHVFNAYLNLAACIDPDFLEEFIQRNRERYPGIDTDRTRMTAITKGEWALREIKEIITLSDEIDMDPLEFKGSYAGAIGPAQFIPSSVVNYFKDGNSDGIRDPFDMEDAIASIAYYLNKAGWNVDETSRKNAVWNYNHHDYYVKTIMGLLKELSSAGNDSESGIIEDSPVQGNP